MIDASVGPKWVLDEPGKEVAADLARSLDHPVYDCLYLALAVRENTYVVTADRRFHAAAQRTAATRGAVRLLGTNA